MEFLSYDQFLNENEEKPRRSVRAKSPMTPILKKSLDRIGKSFKSDEEIVKAIEKLGFVREPLKPNSNGAEYIFVYDTDLDTGKKYRYITYENGYVRAEMPGGHWKIKGYNQTPISDQYIPTTRERLLLVLRRALKKNDLYQLWSKANLKSDDPVSEFFKKFKGTLAGRKYGL
jgi:hypothetical protein